MVPGASIRIIWILSHFCLETWSQWSFLERECVAFMKGPYKLGAGP